MQIKITMRYHLTPVRMAIMKIQEKTSGKDVEKRENLYTVSGNVNWYNHFEKWYGVFSKSFKKNKYMIQQSRF